jgi:hypothetical protein
VPKTAEERKVDADVRQLAPEHRPEAIAKIWAIMDDENAPYMARLNAANSLLDRGYGRPSQSVEVSAPNCDPRSRSPPRSGQRRRESRNLAALRSKPPGTLICQSVCN